jgi:2-dehydropantoate 2-reductase
MGRVRFVIYGAGAVGGVLGAGLHQAGYPVTLVARGAHLAAIEAHGLRLDTPDTSVHLPIPAVGHPSALDLLPDDVVVLAMKTQDTLDALRTLAATAPPTVRVACAQNGVANEDFALRFFADVYGVCVMCPATHTAPGVVQAHGVPVLGRLDVGRHPDGIGAAGEIAAAFRAAGFDADARTEIMPLKYTKLLSNLANAAEALCGLDADISAIVVRVREEAMACLRAIGVEPADDTGLRRFKVLDTVGGPRTGGSSWQSLARGAGSIETDYLNGEVVLLGRRLGIPTPVNARLQALAADAVRTGAPPGSVRPEEVLAIR